MYSVDIQSTPNLQTATKAAAKVGIDHQFILADSATVRFQLPVDLLFIDTWHIYGHLRRELAQHHAIVKRYILLHDTEIDHDVGESVRMKRNVGAESRRSGYPVCEIRLGLWPAVEEFLAKHPEWELKAHYRNNNGLTVLHRIGVPTVTMWDMACMNRHSLMPNTLGVSIAVLFLVLWIVILLQTTRTRWNS